MSVRFDNSGLKKFQRKLKAFQEELNANASLVELFSAQFMGRCSAFADMEAWFAANGVTSTEEFEALSVDDRDRLVRESTTFPGWDEMLKAAGDEWLQRKINEAGLGSR